MFIQNVTIYDECSHLFICLSLTTIPLRSVSSISQVRNLSMCLPAEFQASSDTSSRCFVNQSWCCGCFLDVWSWFLGLILSDPHVMAQCHPFSVSDCFVVVLNKTQLGMPVTIFL